MKRLISLLHQPRGKEVRMERREEKRREKRERERARHYLSFLLVQ